MVTRTVQLAAFVSVLVLSGCATWIPWLAAPPSSAELSTPQMRAVQNARAATALDSLTALTDTDVLIRLNNALLRQHMLGVLREAAGRLEAPAPREIEIVFGRQLIHLSAQVDLEAEAPATIELTGDIRLAFSGNDLIWLPKFERGRVVNEDRSNGGGTPVAAPDMRLWIDRANRALTDPLIILGDNTVPLEPMPLGKLSVGGETGAFPQMEGAAERALGGVFIVAGSAILIEPRATSAVLDLEFVPHISDCATDLSVGRAGFASEIRDREPVGLSRYVGVENQNRYFFTEVRGARKETTVVHLWFADGRPVAMEELRVGPSARWRTWSSKGTEGDDARHWEVVVVERDSGCILHSQAIRSEPGAANGGAGGDDGDAWDEYRRAFAQRLAGFSPTEEAPPVAQLEIHRDLLASVLRQSLENLQIDVGMGLKGDGRPLTAMLRPFDAEGMACAARDCSVERACPPAVSRCIRRYDARDCTTCLFRNPLNNRCVNEAEDPICLAARTAQNDVYETMRQECLEEERSERLDCERLVAQEIESCELEAASARERCEATRDFLGGKRPTDRLAGVAGETRVRGRFFARHSAFELTADLTGFAMSVDLRSAASLVGALRFRPVEPDSIMSECLAAWRGPFQVQLQLPPAPYRFVGRTEWREGAIVTEWSDVSISARTSPTPLEAVFLNQPGLLAACQVGLRAEDVSSALAGADATLLRGTLSLDFRPRPTTIALAPSELRLDEVRYQALPVMLNGRVVYEMTQAESP